MALSSPLVVDGVTYNHVHVTNISRSFQVLDGDNAGRVMSGSMVRDVIGTYYNYSVSVDPDRNYTQEYDSLYDVLSSPSEYHTITVPFGQSTITYKAYVTNGSDNLELMESKSNRWGGLSFNFIAMDPNRR